METCKDVIHNISMAFAYGYFNVTDQKVEADSHLGKSTACVTYENVSSNDDFWNDCEQVSVSGQAFSLPEDKQKLLTFMKSKLWFTYRKGFNAIGGTGPTSDTGWGCMLRCGQMMLAQALCMLSLSEDWLWEDKMESHPLAYQCILHQFSDDRSSCYSIHQIAQMGVAEGKEVGQWFGPNTVAQVIKRLSKFDDGNVFCVHVAMDNTVCIEEIENVCTVKLDQNSPTNQAQVSTINPEPSIKEKHTEKTIEQDKELQPDTFWKPLLLIIPLRLGLSEINPVYFKHLKDCLLLEQSVGIIGGKPNHAYYFCGFSDTALIYLDPHTTQPCVKFEEANAKRALNDETYHCSNPGRMLLTQLDPSLALGFLCKTHESFRDLCAKAKSFEKSPRSLPLFEVVDRTPPCGVIESRVLSVKSYSREKRKNNGEGGSSQLDDATCLALDSDESLESDEEFEVLDIY